MKTVNDKTYDPKKLTAKDILLPWHGPFEYMVKNLNEKEGHSKGKASKIAGHILVGQVLGYSALTGGIIALIEYLTH